MLHIESWRDEKVRKTIIINGALNAKIVGQKAHTIAELAGVSVPENTKILIGEVESVDLSEEFLTKNCLLYLQCINQAVLTMFLKRHIDW